MKNSVHFSSASDEWRTPQNFFQACVKRFGPFGLDAACTKASALAPTFYTKEDDALTRSWHGHGKVWLNPPYSRGLQARFLRAASAHAALDGVTTVCLIPARPDTEVWHDVVFPSARVYFLKGRLTFVGAEASAPFPSAVVVFGPNVEPGCEAWDWRAGK